MYKVVVVTASVGLSAWAGYVGTGEADSLSCEGRLSLAGGCALAGGLLSLLLLRWSLFLLGSIAFGGSVHLLFLSVPSLNSLGGMPSLFGYSLLYWICILVSVIAGGVFVHFRRKTAILVCTSMIGGAGVGFSSALLATASRASVPTWVFFLVGGIAFLGGCLFQAWRRRRREKREEEERSVSWLREGSRSRRGRLRESGGSKRRRASAAIREGEEGEGEEGV